MSDSEQIGGQQAEPSDDDQADLLSEPAAVADGTADGAEAAHEDEQADPVAAFEAELRLMPGEWYVVHSYAGYENRVRANPSSRTR